MGTLAAKIKSEKIHEQKQQHYKLLRQALAYRELGCSETVHAMKTAISSLKDISQIKYWIEEYAMSENGDADKLLTSILNKLSSHYLSPVFGVLEEAVKRIEEEASHKVKVAVAEVPFRIDDVQDFIEEFYPNYSSCDDVATEESMYCAIKGEGGSDVVVEYGGMTEVFYKDAYRLRAKILERALENFLENRWKQ